MASRAQRRRGKRLAQKAKPVPGDHRSEDVQLHEKMVQQREAGMSYEDIAEAHGVTTAEIERAERAAGKDTVLAGTPGTGEVQLYNPSADHFEAFIAGNATRCDRVVKQNDALDKTVMICGAGPSLRDHVELLHEADEVWGVNSALKWLHDNGHPVTHALTVDQTPMMIKDWIDPPNVEYLLASTVHPHLIDYLEMHDRRMTFFHSYVGLSKPPVQWDDESGTMRQETYEAWMYMLLYDPTIMTGSGLNSVTRAVDVAIYRGFRRIVLLGADHAIRSPRIPKDMDAGTPEYTDWLEANTEFHVDGGSAIVNGQSPLTFQGEIDGRLWTTKPDMMLSAIQIAKWIRDGVVECIGDTLPNALKDKDAEFIDRLPKMKTAAGDTIRLPWQD